MLAKGADFLPRQRLARPGLVCHNASMPTRSSKRKVTDPNVRASLTVQQVTGTPSPEPEGTAKNPHAVALGKLGGIKGGRARMQRLSPKKRRAIARKAARARWKKQ
jgi:hypothetical protein